MKIRINKKNYDTESIVFRRLHKHNKIPKEFYRYILQDKAKLLKHEPSRFGDRQGFFRFLEAVEVKHYYQNCCICYFNRFIQFCHLVPHHEGGFYTIDNVIPLCPNHHRCLDRFMLEDWEYYKIQEFIWRRIVSIMPYYFETNI